MNPKVFLSHASEDKDRFVLNFAEKLRANGVDAWVDKWEMYPGDSLIDKIFEEGIKNADAVIIVLSKNSVQKPWVIEEINASMVKKINEKSKLIPVVIDDCDIPECLKSTVYERVANINDFDDELERILYSIYGKTERPPLGSPPPYAQEELPSLPDLTELDTLIFKVSCEQAIRDEQPHVSTKNVIHEIAPRGYPESEIIDSINLLDERGYIEGLRVLALTYPPHFKISLYGFGEYASNFLSDYEQSINSIAYDIVNNNGGDNSSLSKKFNIPRLVVDFILDILESKGLIRTTSGMAGYRFIQVIWVSVELKRLLK